MIFSCNESVKCAIASLIHAGARLDRDENHVQETIDDVFIRFIIVDERACFLAVGILR
jgi:hypothetical protein